MENKIFKGQDVERQAVPTDILEILKRQPHLLQIMRMQTDEQEPRCYICGCYWVEGDLCSACARMVYPEHTP